MQQGCEQQDSTQGVEWLAHGVQGLPQGSLVLQADPPDRTLVVEFQSVHHPPSSLCVRWPLVVPGAAGSLV